MLSSSPATTGLSVLGRRAAVLAGSIILASGIAQADDKPACERFDWPLAIERSWFTAGDMPVVETGQKLASLPAQGLTLTLRPAADVTLAAATRPPRVDAPKSGVVTFTVPAAGLYQVTISADGWVDVVQDGAIVATQAHTGNRDCVGLRKSVRYKLKAGEAAIQVTSVPADRIMVGIRAVE